MSSSVTDVNQFDPLNPDPWLALYLDTNSYIDETAKEALLGGNASWSRRFFFPIAFPVARLFIALVKLFRVLFPNHPQSCRLLHLSIYWGLKYFVSPGANYLIVRHFNIGTENLKFIADNIPGIEIKTTKPLRPKCLEDLIDNTFLIHDLNIYNFIIELNRQLREKNMEVTQPEKINFEAISTEPFDIAPMPNKWHNLLTYTPLWSFIHRCTHCFYRMRIFGGPVIPCNWIRPLPYISPRY